ncbi:hypothetical protein BK816_03725 [Boudabousia tangfeifanii]|uniref:DUF8094 domain-containing protein n=1 Tax=Boudabousia tangfeifanii TaxID=1912795 RepID=A0A1D9MJQ3_9ACTO|nr:hypothetical protein [Boudabousia tangfeifanii]AOZ72516.1 hypothetical protein BK816_03725 [Boudabousia tangfeifanii]
MSKRLLSSALIALSALGLGACAATLPTPTAPQNESYPNLDQDRADRILEQTRTLLADTAKTNDAGPLKERLSGAALMMRSAEYEVAKASGSPAPEINLTSQAVTVANGETWPRAMFNISEKTGTQTRTVSVFLQDDAFNQYKLSNWVRLLPGVTLPATARVETGAQMLPETATGYVLSPRDAVNAYVSVLNNPEAAETKDFENDAFANYYHDYVKQWTERVQQIAEVNSNMAVAEKPIVAIQTGNGDALVSATVKYRVTTKVTLEGSSLTATGSVGLLLGDQKTATGQLSTLHLANILMVVPKANSGQKIQVVGAETVPIQAETKSWTDTGRTIEPTPEIK